MSTNKGFFRVVQQVGDDAKDVSEWMQEGAALVRADVLQEQNPRKRYAVVELCYRYFTKPPNAGEQHR